MCAFTVPKNTLFVIAALEFATPDVHNSSIVNVTRNITVAFACFANSRQRKRIPRQKQQLACALPIKSNIIFDFNSFTFACSPVEVPLNAHTRLGPLKVAPLAFRTIQ